VNRLFVFGANYDASGSKARGSRSGTFDRYMQKCRMDYQQVNRTTRGFNALIDALLPLWRTPSGITRDQLRAIQVPVAIADGDHDEIILIEQIREMAQLIPHGKLVIFSETSHFALWQDPAGFNQAMLGFLTEPDDPPTAAP
ncbi:MAG TPA: alpha/beta hydrolase, partial [Kofleriaceae bacterium]|nr:alpha/beta hydrolase [Kofleriaceae bacterium]